MTVRRMSMMPMLALMAMLEMMKSGSHSHQYWARQFGLPSLVLPNIKYLQCDRKIALGCDINMVLSCAMPYAVETQCCEDCYACLHKRLVSMYLANVEGKAH